MQPLTVLQIIPSLDTGGAELSAIEISEAIVRAGGRSIIATEGGRLEITAREQGAEILRFPAATKNPARMLANSRALIRISRQEKIQLLHARSRAPAWSALWAARHAGLPFVTTYHGAYNENGPFKRFYNSVMARGDIVIANSEFTANLIHQRHKTPDARLRVIHRGVDAAFGAQHIAPQRINELRSKWGLTSEQRIILQAARLTSWKGQRVVIEAAGILHQAGQLDDVVFVLAGDDQGRAAYRQDLQSLIRRLALDEHVKLAGHVSDMPAAFAASHIGIIASTEPEAFGRTAIEAQALGCPVIATRLGAPQETVLAEPEVSEDARTGWLVTAGDAQAIADAIAEALQLSHGQRHDLGERAKRNVQTRFTLEQMKRRTLEIYDQLLGSRLVQAFDRAQQNSSVL